MARRGSGATANTGHAPASTIHGSIVNQSSEPAKNLGGRPERTIAISESVIVEMVLAGKAVEAAAVRLYRARQAFVEEANASIARSERAA